MATSPAGPQFCTQNDLELTVGGAQQLAQLLDKNGDGIADSDMVTSVIGRASAEVASAIANQVQISTLTAPYPDELVFVTANIAAFYAWCMGSSQIVIPDGAKLMHEDALRYLDQVSRRERAIGSATEPAHSLEAKSINIDPNNVATTRASTQGFW